MTTTEVATRPRDAMVLAAVYAELEMLSAMAAGMGRAEAAEASWDYQRRHALPSSPPPSWTRTSSAC